MQRQWTAPLALRAVIVLLIAFGLVVTGVLIDMAAGTSPIGVLIFLVIALTFGTIMIYLIVTSSFPAAREETGDEQKSDD